MPITAGITTGWKPACGCRGNKPIPAVVLDPFAGTATTGIVAIEHGRSFLGFELNPKDVKDHAGPRLRKALKGAKA